MKQKERNDGIQQIKAYLSNQPTGEITDNSTIVETKRLLAGIWDILRGSDETKMRDYKLCRIENIRWQPPAVISFIIERHGMTVNGSSRAELQPWSVNLDTLVANVDRNAIRYRQLYPTSPPLTKEKIDHLVQTFLEDLGQGRQNQYTYTQKNELRILIQKIIPEGDPQTTSQRRKRFRTALTEALKPLGWAEKRPNYYVRTTPIHD